MGIVACQTQHDIYGNAVIGKDVHLFDSKNCIVHTTEERKVVIQGLDGYIVAEQMVNCLFVAFLKSSV